ncbi:hypothetical protein B2G51_01765 [Leptospira santarosai]|nr:hypothetical protein B2G51_01765 [Leptospira santarosai]
MNLLKHILKRPDLPLHSIEATQISGLKNSETYESLSELRSSGFLVFLSGFYFLNPDMLDKHGFLRKGSLKEQILRLMLSRPETTWSITEIALVLVSNHQKIKKAVHKFCSEGLLDCIFLLGNSKAFRLKPDFRPKQNDKVLLLKRIEQYGG